LSKAERSRVIDATESFFQRFTATDDFFGGQLPSPSTQRPQDIASAIRQIKNTKVRELASAAFVLADPKWDSLNLSRVASATRRLRELLIALPELQNDLRIIEGDARQIPIEDHSIDLVLTSPPYINVFNYHQQYRPAVEALGHDVLDAARSEIGSNRKHRMNRFLTVVQYAIDMDAVIAEMKRLLKPGGRMIFVLGRESRVRGIPIFNGDLFCEVATRAGGLRVLTRQERAFTNRFGERIVEDILHFEVTQSAARSSASSARHIARECLEYLLPTADGEVKSDIAAAIQLSANVLPSPLLTVERT
jgi:SAM-dependent methyltransferase